MSSDLERKIARLEEVIIRRFENLEQGIREGFDDHDRTLSDECEDTGTIRPMVPRETDVFDFSTNAVRSAIWTRGINRKKDRTWRFTCRAMVWNYYHFRLWEDGQFRMVYAARNRSRHARWVTRPRLKFYIDDGTPDQFIKGSRIKFHSIGGKERKYVTHVQSGTWRFGRDNFDLLTGPKAYARAAQKCERTF